MDEWKIIFNIKGTLIFPDENIINDVTIKCNNDNNIQASLIVKADDDIEALNIAIRKVNDILDVLSIITNAQLQINMDEKQIKNITSSTQHAYFSSNACIALLCKKENIDKTKQILNNIQTNDTTYLRALGWYRKGLNGTDPFDIFLAFWNSIENITNKFGPTGDDINGSKDKIIKMLEEYLFKNYDEEIREYCNYRNNIVHGVKSVSHEQIILISSKIPKLKKIANEFLNEFANKNYILKNN